PSVSTSSLAADGDPSRGWLWLAGEPAVFLRASSLRGGFRGCVGSRPSFCGRYCTSRNRLELDHRIPPGPFFYHILQINRNICRIAKERLGLEDVSKMIFPQASSILKLVW